MERGLACAQLICPRGALTQGEARSQRRRLAWDSPSGLCLPQLSTGRTSHPSPLMGLKPSRLRAKTSPGCPSPDFCTSPEPVRPRTSVAWLVLTSSS